MAQDRDTFYVVGGYNGTISSFDTVYRYQTSNQRAILQTQLNIYQE